MPFFASNCEKGVPSLAAVRRVSSKRITPLIASSSPVSGKKHITIGLAIVLIGFDIDAVEPSFDRAHALVGGENAFAFGHHRLGNFFQLLL